MEFGSLDARPTFAIPRAQIVLSLTGYTLTEAGLAYTTCRVKEGVPRGRLIDSTGYLNQQRFWFVIVGLCSP